MAIPSTTCVPEFETNTPYVDIPPQRHNDSVLNFNDGGLVKSPFNADSPNHHYSSNEPDLDHNANSQEMIPTRHQSSADFPTTTHSQGPSPNVQDSLSDDFASQCSNRAMTRLVEGPLLPPHLVEGYEDHSAEDLPVPDQYPIFPLVYNRFLREDEVELVSHVESIWARARVLMALAVPRLLLSGEVCCKSEQRVIKSSNRKKKKNKRKEHHPTTELLSAVQMQQSLVDRCLLGDLSTKEYSILIDQVKALVEDLPHDDMQALPAQLMEYVPQGKCHLVSEQHTWNLNKAKARFVDAMIMAQHIQRHEDDSLDGMLAERGWIEQLLSDIPDPFLTSLPPDLLDFLADHRLKFVDGSVLHKLHPERVPNLDISQVPYLDAIQIQHITEEQFDGIARGQIKDLPSHRFIQWYRRHPLKHDLNVHEE